MFISLHMASMLEPFLTTIQYTFISLHRHQHARTLPNNQVQYMFISLHIGPFLTTRYQHARTLPNNQVQYTLVHGQHASLHMFISLHMASMLGPFLTTRYSTRSLVSGPFLTTRRHGQHARALPNNQVQYMFISLHRRQHARTLPNNQVQYTFISLHMASMLGPFLTTRYSKKQHARQKGTQSPHLYSSTWIQ